MNSTSAPYRFHASDLSYFSAKVRPALRYKRLWFEELRADRHEVQRRTGLGFIPILITPQDETWQDTSEILDHLEARHPDPPLQPTTPVQRIAALLVELYTDEFALLPAMHYRWASPLGAATTRARFAAMFGDATAAERLADRMATARIHLGATDETGPAIEAHTKDLLAALSTHFAEHAYLLGARMSLADCALMGPVYGHFFNDLVSRRLLLETAVPVVAWVERCNAPNPASQGDWLAGDALAASFRNVLEVMAQDAVPVLLACIRTIEGWADTRPDDGEPPPRAVGMAVSALRGTPLQRVALPYTLWMLQRVLDAYATLAPDDRAAVDREIAGTGWEAVLAYEPRHRVAKRGFQLVFEGPVSEGPTP